MTQIRGPHGTSLCPWARVTNKKQSTGKVEIDPGKVADIAEKLYTERMAATSNKTGAHLLSSPKAKRNYPCMERQCKSHFLLETLIIRENGM
eukprot:1136760-Pelagomonas_calceolata.AAC.1